MLRINNIMNRFFLIITFFCFISYNSKSQDTIFIKNSLIEIDNYIGDDSISISPIYYYIDTIGNQTLKDIICQQFNNKIVRGQPIFHVGTGSVWYKIIIKNLNQHDRFFFINSDYDKSNIITLYDTTLKQYNSVMNGFSVPDSLRDIPFGRSVTFNINYNETKTIFLEIRSQLKARPIYPEIQITIFPVIKRIGRLINERLYGGIIIGLLLLMAIYHLLLFIKTKQIEYLAYSSYSLSSAYFYFSYAIAISFFGFHRIFSITTSTVVCLVSYIFLALYYGNIKEYFPNTFKRFKVILISISLLITIALQGIFFSILEEIFYSIICILFLVILMPVLYSFIPYFKLIINRVKEAKYFLLANLIFIICFLISMFFLRLDFDNNFATILLLITITPIYFIALYLIIKENREKKVIYHQLIFFIFIAVYLLIVFNYVSLGNFLDKISPYSLEAGFVIQMLIFALGLADKMQQSLLEKNKSQKELIEQLQVNAELKDKVNRELEQKVKERTAEIEQQKEEILSQNEEIIAQRDLLFRQNKDITDSIEYARYIQQALLNSVDVIQNSNLQNFILYIPRDIISGDFYWFKRIKNYVYFTAADCTGHGVPGAFMSVLGISLLNEIVSKRDLNPPATILNELRKKIIRSLSHENQSNKSHDGIDISLCLFDFESKLLQFAGAYNPLIIVRDNNIIELNADRMPVGIHPKDYLEFTNHTIQLEPNDMLYLFSDGYLSQFGGETGKRYGIKRFKQLLIDISNKPIDLQYQLLEKELLSWKRDFEQIDDILIIGIKIPEL